MRHLPLSRGLFLISALVFSQACAPTKVTCPSDYRIDFIEALHFAEKAELAYASDSAVFADTTVDSSFIVIGEHTSSRAIVQRNDSTKIQWVAFRGTQTFDDAKIDAQYTQEPDSALGVYLHSGFSAASHDLLPQILPHLNPEYATYLSGHSLGGGIAVIAALTLQRKGFQVKCRTFGQPKVTNEAGAAQFHDLDLIRFIHGKDLVALVPPFDWKPGQQLGSYAHFGREVALTDKSYECLLEHDSKRYNPHAWWDEAHRQALTDHAMADYEKTLTVWALKPVL